ncbi:MAG: hypothetical protein PF487_08630 [Bacteroidales bacterium]|jgi:hypothetical protein|nr:hypothetical protein [Bacteroidales bacterium]
MYRNKIQSAIAVIFILLFSKEIKADNNTSLINYKIDFRNQHIWRGKQTSRMPCIEPSAWLTKNNLEIGVWAAQSVDGQYSELDFFLTYSIKKFSFSFYDYYCPTKINSIEFLNYNNSTTKHSFDLNFTYNGGENFPLSIMFSTMIYGDDKNPTNKKNYYSSYIEFNYSKLIKQNKLSFFLGLTPTGSYYNNNFGIINTGISASSKIKMHNNYKIPIVASIITKPIKKDLFLVIGFSI